MKNLAIFTKLIDGYNKHAFTHHYLLGFRYNGNIWVAETTGKNLQLLLKLDKASRGAGYSIRFKPDKAQKMLLMAMNARILCSEKYFDELVKSSKYNRGEILEKLLTEEAGKTWEKDDIPFWKDGDLEINGISYQIKFEKATFTNEKILASLH